MGKAKKVLTFELSWILLSAEQKPSLLGQNKEQQWQICCYGRCKMAHFLWAESPTIDYLISHYFAWDCYQINPPSVILFAPAEVWTMLQLLQSPGIFSGLSWILFYIENQQSRIFLSKLIPWLVKTLTGPIVSSVYPLYVAWCASLVIAGLGILLSLSWN